MPILNSLGAMSLRNFGMTKGGGKGAGAQVALGYWPPRYETLINSSTYTKYFINDATGNDSNDGLSEAAPFKTFDRFYTVTKALPIAVMGVVYPGTYNCASKIINGAAVVYGDTDLGTSELTAYPRKVVGYPGKVQIVWTADSAVRDCGMVHFGNIASKAYGIIWKRDSYYRASPSRRGSNYMVAFIRGFGDYKGNMYNCVLEETNPSNHWSICYANSGYPSNKPGLNYCTFAVKAAGMGDYSGNGNLVIDHCLFNWTYTSSPATFTNCQIPTTHPVNFTDYTTPGYGATSGVYYGSYAWPGVIYTWPPV